MVVKVVVGSCGCVARVQVVAKRRLCVHWLSQRWTYCRPRRQMDFLVCRRKDSSTNLPSPSGFLLHVRASAESPYENGLL